MKTYLNEYSPGDSLKTTLYLRKMSLRNKRSGGKFLSLELADKTMSIDAVAWDDAEELASALSVGDFVEAEGQVGMYQDKRQLVLSSLRRVDPGCLDFADFLPATDKDIGQLWNQLLELIGSVKNSWLKLLLDRVFGDEDTARSFRTAPGALSVHHNYVGGLLEHTVGVAALCDAASRLYPDVDRDLLLAGGILHDIGKLEEYSVGGHIGITDEGQLLGHIVIGDAMIGRIIRSIPGFPPRLALRIRHVIVSHHGQLEWGSPKMPATIEALLVHHIENLDAKVATYRTAAGDTTDGVWSAYSHAVKTQFLVEPVDLSVQPDEDIIEPGPRKDSMEAVQETLDLN